MFTWSNICCKPIRAKHGSRDIAGNKLLFVDFVMAAIRGKAFRSGLTPLVSSPVNEEDNSDFDSSCSTLSEVENENSPPQSQVPLKRTASVVVQREDPRGKFPPKQFCFLTKQLVLPRSYFLLFFCYFSDWDVQRVKVWVKALFNDEDIARKFEAEEIEGSTLQSERILSDAAMNSLGLSTIGMKDKFAIAVQDLFGKFIKVALIQSIFISGVLQALNFAQLQINLHIKLTVFRSFVPIILNQFY